MCMVYLGLDMKLRTQFKMLCYHLNQVGPN